MGCPDAGSAFSSTFCISEVKAGVVPFPVKSKKQPLAGLAGLGPTLPPIPFERGWGGKGTGFPIGNSI